MIFYQLKIKNLLQFNDFSIDFTYPKQSKFSPILQTHSEFPKLRFKKFGIILGANASGKTTFGKIMCLIQNFIRGYDISNLGFLSLKNDFAFDKTQSSEFNVIFSVKKAMYYLNVSFNSKGILSEEWRRINISNQPFQNLKNELLNSTIIYDNHETNNLFTSSFISNVSFKSFAEEIDNDLGFLYSYSGDSQTKFSNDNKIDSITLTKILTSFDPSIKHVIDSIDIEGNKIIVFKNDHKETIKSDGSLVDSSSSILSTGTKESIFLSYLIFRMTNRLHHTYYVDEKMSHSHSEIEKQIIQIFISLIEKVDGQVFITSHNSELLDLDLPNYNFILFKKNRDGSISDAIQPERTIKHQNRSLRKIVNEDVFSTSPNLDELISLHSKLLDDMS